jgi:uroporphyrinogen-III synthase
LHQVGAGATTYDRCKQSRERDVTDPKTGPAVGLLMTRPLPSARRFVEDLSAETRAGLTVIYAPLMRVRPLSGALGATDTQGVGGLIFTSANAVATATGQVSTDLPAYCVGQRTTAEAIGAGWPAQCLGKTADELIARLVDMRPPAPLLHLHGRHTRGDVAQRLTAAGLSCREKVIYDQELLPLNEDALRAITSQQSLIVPVFSPRTARHFAQICPDASNLHLIALSEAVAKPLKVLNCRDLQVCNTPDAGAMSTLVRDAADA